MEDDVVLDGNEYTTLVQEYAGRENAGVITMCAKMESELAELEESEKKQFLKELGINYSGLDKLIFATYDLLGLQTFFTVGKDEVRAWTFKKGMVAKKCAGLIHSDIERGFIKAEIMKFNDLEELKDEKKVQEAGKLNLEGKDYIMQDGDIVYIFINLCYNNYIYVKEIIMKNKIMSKTFIWMFLGLLVTFVTGFGVSNNETMIINIFKNSTYIILAIIELALVVFLSARVRKMNKNTARIFFLLYSFISGLTFSSIFIVYKLTSILYVFLVAAIIFLIFGLIGYFTKIDLTKLGTYLMMALIAIIICIIINLFVGNSTFDLIISIISILIFIGFTAYDVQKIKQISYENVDEDNLAIVGALNLYLDYINIFLNLLSIFGDSKN